MGNFKKKVKRTRRRMRRKRAPRVARAKNQLVIPDRLYTKVKYTELLNVSTTATMSTYTFGGNCLHDPNITGAGHQPYGYDQLMTLYNKYTCFGSKIKVTYCADTTNTRCAYLTVRPTINDAPTATQLIDVLELPNVRDKTCNSGERCSVNNFARTKHILGVHDVLDNPDLSALIGANPLKKWYWIINTQGGDLTTTISGDIRVEVTYYALFSERARAPQS